MFPDEELLGVDIIVPDITFLLENKSEVKAIFLTHGHEDHIGALPFVASLPECSALRQQLHDGSGQEQARSARLARRKLSSTRSRRRRQIEVGRFSVEFFHVTHSIVDSFALAIKTPAGTIIHTGDFKIDPTPIDGKLFDLHTLAAYGDQGVLALVLRQHECRTCRIHGFGTHGQRPLRIDLQSVRRDGSSCRVSLRRSRDCNLSSTRRSSTAAW